MRYVLIPVCCTVLPSIASTGIIAGSRPLPVQISCKFPSVHGVRSEEHAPAIKPGVKMHQSHSVLGPLFVLRYWWIWFLEYLATSVICFCLQISWINMPCKQGILQEQQAPAGPSERKYHNINSLIISCELQKSWRTFTCHFLGLCHLQWFIFLASNHWTSMMQKWIDLLHRVTFKIQYVRCNATRKVLSVITCSPLFRAGAVCLLQTGQGNLLCLQHPLKLLQDSVQIAYIVACYMCEVTWVIR